MTRGVAGNEPAAAPPPVLIGRSDSIQPYIAAAVLAALLGVPISLLPTVFSPLSRRSSSSSSTGAESTPRRSCTCVVAGSVVGAVRAADGLDHPVSAGNRGTLTRFRIQRRRRSAERRELVGIVLAALTTLSMGAVLGPEGR